MICKTTTVFNSTFQELFVDFMDLHLKEELELYTFNKTLISLKQIEETGNLLTMEITQWNKFAF